MDPQDGVCLGCYRTRAEIAAWRSMDQNDQLALLEILRHRRATATGVARRPSRRNVKRLSVSTVKAGVMAAPPIGKESKSNVQYPIRSN